MSDSEEDFFNELRAEINKEKESISTPIAEKQKPVVSPARAEEKESLHKMATDMDSRSGLRLRRRIYSAAQCDKDLQNVEFLPLNKVETHTALFNSIHVGNKPNDNWASIGVIDKYYPQTDFCVTRITDMRGVYVNLYITGKAYTKYLEKIGMGSVIAIKRPFLLKPTETTHSIALHVDQIQQTWVIGQSLDLVQCAGYAKKDVRCSEWTDIRSGEYCDTHLARVCNYSKNGRMELASGDSGFDIRWATKIKQVDGSVLYESKIKRTQKAADPLAKVMMGSKSKLKEAYYLKGKGLVATDGSLIKKKLPQKQTPTQMEKDELREFLKGRRDPGSEMIRKIKGIHDERPRTVLSKEALDKMGIGIKQLSKDQEESKKRTIDALNKSNTEKNNEKEKKPRYVYL